MGHMIEDLAGKIVGYDSVAPMRAISQTGIKNELRAVYNDLNNPLLNQRRVMLGREPDIGKSSVLRNFGPEQFGYSANAIERELMAEAIRAYMADPNYLKTVAPKTAAAIRAAWNPTARSRDTVQFNSIGSAHGAALVPTRGEGE